MSASTPARQVACAVVAACTAAVALTAAPAAAAPAPEEVRSGPYSAQIRWTTHGIPHITAPDIGSLGFANGFAAARDNLCVIAETVLTVDGRRTQALGATQENVVSDTFQGWVRQSGVVEELLTRGPDDPVPGPSAEARAQVAGFAAGYNQWLAEVGGRAGVTDPRCAGADWVRPLSALDIWRRSYDSVLRASSGALAAGLVAAQPPVAGARALSPDDVPVEMPGELPEAGLGSNAYGLGARATVSGHGMVLGNPHFPWDGPDRFWQSHQTIPGQLDVQGASLLGTPGVQIGFTRGVAWSHTVSTGQRFALRQLQLGATPTSYVVDGATRQMRPIQVAVPGGPTRTVWESDFGPIVVRPDLGLGWTSTTAYALTDANADNLRALDTWNAMSRAQDVDELVAAMTTWQGIPWVNTTGADSTGKALYAQLAVVTAVPDELALRCIPAGRLQAIWRSSGLAVLDGSRSDCGPVSQPDAAVPGILGPGALPVLTTDTYVTQSNDSHWLSNPDQRLEGFARVIGDERTPRSLRTRLGILQVEQRLAGTDGLPGTKFTVPRLQQVMFSNRTHGGELVADDLVALCRATPSAAAADGQQVPLAPACEALAVWNRRDDLDSRGAALFREFARAGGLSFAVPFDLDAPVTTPNTLNTGDPAVLRALATATQRLQAAGIALDAPLGALQTEPRGQERIPIHGGPGFSGVFNVINASFRGEQGYPEVDGNSSSFLMAVEVTGSGPVGSTIMAYSQSSDPTSPYFADQTRLYSAKRWVPIRWTNAAIEEATVERRTLVQTRQPVPAPDFTRTACPPASLPPSPFRDVGGERMEAVAIRCIAAHGITLGRGGGLYDPATSVTRGQMVLFLSRYAVVAGGELPVGRPTFSDAASLPPEVRAAAEALAVAGVVAGRSDGAGGVRLDAQAPVSRGQMAAFLVRLERFLRDDPTALTATGVDVDAFPDDAGAFEAYIDGLASVGVAQGTTLTTFSPDRPVSRQQMALFLARLLQLDEVPPPAP